MLKHPSLGILSPNFTRADLFLVVFCLVDDWMKQRYGSSNKPRKTHGPGHHEIADSEVITLLLVGQLCRCPREQAWLRQVRANYGALFPHLPEDSRFWRRAQYVREQLRALRQSILFWADADLEPIRIFDSFPMPLCACYRIRQSSQPITGSAFAYNHSKRQYYFGLHPGLLMTGSGYVEDIVLAPGWCMDTPLLAAYLDECQQEGRDLSQQDWFLDKGFFNGSLAERAHEQTGAHILARRRDYPKELRELDPPFWQQLIDKVRKPIETMIATLTEYFGLEHMLAHSDWGLYRRVQTIATAVALARYFNQALDATDPMNFAQYAV